MNIRDNLIPQVTGNCMISDARYWGHYTTCGLLLRLRELYRFEHRRGAFEPLDNADVLGWIGTREEAWAALEDASLEPLSINGRRLDPMDAVEVNGLLAGSGLLYGAGYGMFMKPVFFLADLEAMYEVDGVRVHVAGREHVRDISLHPAMAQGGSVILRRSMIEALMFERFDEFRAKRQRTDALSRGFISYGIEPGSTEADIVRAADLEMESFLWHEVGEIRQQPCSRWAEALGSLRHGRAAMFMRAVKDTLADTCDAGTLDNIIENRREGSLWFYVASLRGFRHSLAGAFAGMSDIDWAWAGQERLACFNSAAHIAGRICAAIESCGDEGLEAAVESVMAEALMLKPGRKPS